MGLGVFQIVTHPAAPGNCRGCGVPYGVRDMIDTSLSSDFCNRPHWDPVTETVDNEVDINLAGTVYFCESCVTNMAELIGMRDALKVKALENELDELRELAAGLSARNLGLEKIVDGYRDISALGVSELVTVSGSALPENFDDGNSSGSTSDSPKQEQIVGESSDGSDVGSSETDESTGEQKRERVSRDSGSKSGDSGNDTVDTSGNVLGF